MQINRAKEILPAITRLEHHENTPSMRVICDEYIADLRRLLNAGQLNGKQFTRFAGRVWNKREKVADHALNTDLSDIRYKPLQPTARGAITHEK